MFSCFKKEKQIENLDCTTDEYFIKKAWKENFGFWLTQAGIYRSNGILVVVFVTISLALEVLFGITLTLISIDDIASICECIHFIAFLFIEMNASISFILYKKTIDNIYLTMGRKFYDYENTLDKESYKLISEVNKKATWRKKMAHLVLSVFTIGTLIAAIGFRPFTTYYFGNPNPADGLERMLPAFIWSPFGAGTWQSILILFLAEGVVSYVTPGLVLGCTIFIVCTCEELGAQMSILGHTLKYAIRRAESLNMPREEAIKLCFKHSIHHHQMLIVFIKSLEFIIYLPGFGLLFGSTILMCMSGFIFVSKEVSFASKIVFILFLLSEQTMVFLFCAYGEYVQQASIKIADMVYSSEWPENMKELKYYTMMIQLRSMRPLKINFGGFLVASLVTYSNICSSAFSYFNLILAGN